MKVLVLGKSVSKMNDHNSKNQQKRKRQKLKKSKFHKPNLRQSKEKKYDYEDPLFIKFFSFVFRPLNLFLILSSSFTLLWLLINHDVLNQKLIDFIILFGEFYIVGYIIILALPFFDSDTSKVNWRYIPSVLMYPLLGNIFPGINFKTSCVISLIGFALVLLFSVSKTFRKIVNYISDHV